MSEGQTPKDTQELIAEMEREWKALMEVVDRLNPQQMITPDAGGWSPKDNLAHLTTWMNFMVKCYLERQPAHVAMGIDVEKFRSLDETGINAVIFERNRDRSTADVVKELKTTYEEVVKKLKSVPFSALMKPFQRDDPQQRPVIGWVLGNTSEHFAEHRVILERVDQARK